jgi:hypothetical protein
MKLKETLRGAGHYKPTFKLIDKKLITDVKFDKPDIRSQII